MGFRPRVLSQPTVATEHSLAVNAASAAILAGTALCIYFALRTELPRKTQPLGFAPWKTQALGFVINILSVSIPGRFDSDIEPGDTLQFPWPTLLNPAGFAFAIWGVIYLGEIAGMAVMLTAAKDTVGGAVGPASVSWLCANVAQCLWCAAFRPWALSSLWLSTACLGATATCLIASQRELLHLRAHTSGAEAHAWQWALVIMPRSLHAGWVTAAALVNVNAWVGKAALGAPTALACAILSLFGGVALADWYATSGLKMSACACAWALFAVSKGTPVGRDAEAVGPVAIDGFAQAAAASAMLVLVVMMVRKPAA